MRLEEILCHTQSKLKKRLSAELRKIGYRPVSKKGFLYAPGDVSVLLVAHLDTVHKESVKQICRSDDGNKLMSPQGIGGDDRAGIYMIMEILKNHKCHVLFCEDEESGCVGARCFTSAKIYPKVNYILEFDRRGSNDAIFYDCANPHFTKFICSFDFIARSGSFSDISVIAPYLGIAAVNLSAGYFDAHSKGESIDLSIVHRNIGKVRKMLSTKTQAFLYIKRPSLLRRWNGVFNCSEINQISRDLGLIDDEMFFDSMICLEASDNDGEQEAEFEQQTIPATSK